MADTIDHETGEIIEASAITPRPKRPPMSPEIAKAIISVNKRVTSLGKDEENKFGHFKYTSVDAFYEAIGPLMADAGIFVFTDEVDTEIERREGTDDQGRARVTNWLITKYEIMIYHESGAEWGPIRREMMVAATGPQAYGAGQSYVEKYFLRGLFKVPTGDPDADGHPQAGLPERPQTRGATRTARPTPPPAVPPTANRATGSAVNRQDGVTSATESHGPFATGNGRDSAPLSPRKLMWVKSKFAEQSCEINPRLVPGGWSEWERLYLMFVANADNEDQIEKLRRDNEEHLKAFHAAHKEDVWIAFSTEIAANIKRLRGQEAVTPSETQGVLMG